MKTLNYTGTAVQSELSAISDKAKETVKTAKGTKPGKEALLAALTLTGVVLAFIALNHFGYIREF